MKACFRNTPSAVGKYKTSQLVLYYRAQPNLRAEEQRDEARKLVQAMAKSMIRTLCSQLSLGLWAKGIAMSGKAERWLRP
ncbi:MAG: hypothetical protein J6R71_07205 [Bacteroidales bacterium]|nr:hypothetical protein [Bacteroidales bacterium]